MGFRRKTRPGRLRALDAIVAALEPSLVAADGPFAGLPVVDLGIGAQPWTTVELADALDGVEVVGVDIGADLVAAAQVYSRPGLRFVHGSFDLPVPAARWVRVMNVCRDLGPDAVPDAHARIGGAVVDGGLVVEGSCGPNGEVGVAHWLRKRGGALRREGLVLWADGSRGDAPLVFRDRLPRDLRGAGSHPAHAMLGEWMREYTARPPGPERWAEAAAAVPHLRPIGPRAALWAPPGGVPPRLTGAGRS